MPSKTPSKKRKRAQREDSPESQPDLPSTSNKVSNYSPDKIVTLIIGEGDEEVTMVVHTAYIALTSDFFKAALKKEWLEGQTRVIKLPKELKWALERYIEFIYGRDNFSSCMKTIEDATGVHVFYWLAQLYTFGERILDTSFCNRVIKEFLRICDIEEEREDGRKIRMRPNSDTFELVYEKTTVNSPMRRLLVDLYVVGGLEGQDLYELPAEFAIELACALDAKIRDCDKTSEFRWRELEVEDYLV